MEDFGFFNQFVIRNPMNNELTTLKDFWKYLEKYVEEHERFRDCYYTANHANIILKPCRADIKILDPVIDEFIPLDVFKSNYISYHKYYDNFNKGILDVRHPIYDNMVSLQTLLDDYQIIYEESLDLKAENNNLKNENERLKEDYRDLKNKYNTLKFNLQDVPGFPTWQYITDLKEQNAKLKRKNKRAGKMIGKLKEKVDMLDFLKDSFQSYNEKLTHGWGSNCITYANMLFCGDDRKLTRVVRYFGGMDESK